MSSRERAMFFVLVITAITGCQGETSDISIMQTQETKSTFLSDLEAYPPPFEGRFDYNAWKPGAAGFPAVGERYIDPVFGGIVRRLSDINHASNEEDIYSHHWANSNGNKCFSTQPGPSGSAILKILDVSTGSVLYDNQPLGSIRFEIAWSPTDPDLYYYFDGPNLMSRKLGVTPVDQVVKTFGTNLESNGGSLNWIDRSGRYFTVRLKGTNNVWDSELDIIYANEVTPLDPENGWVAITPDGNYLVTVAGPSDMPGKEHYSYQIDHDAKLISPTPVQFWGLCGDHGALVSATDGKNYFVSFDCFNDTGIYGVYRIDITVSRLGQTEAQQLQNTPLLIDLSRSLSDAHFTAISKGLLRDWVFVSTESLTDDPFGGDVSGWTPFKQEIVAVNVVSGEIRRLAHHRSRQLDSSYLATPRISSSWDGSAILWTSNFGVGSPIGYADLYGMSFQ